MDITTGSRIKMRREQLGLTQDELAEKVGYTSKSSISHIEQGRITPSFDKLLKIADILHVDVNYLVASYSDEEVHREQEIEKFLVREHEAEYGEKTPEYILEIRRIMDDLPDNAKWMMVGRIAAYVEEMYKRGITK